MNRKAIRRSVVLRVFLPELLLATLCYGATLYFLWHEKDEVAKFIIKISGSFLLPFLFLMLTASIGYYWRFYSQSDSEFMMWIDYEGYYQLFAKGFLYTIAVFFITSIWFIQAPDSLA